MYDKLSELANNICECGGRGPEDEGVCPACAMYHEIRSLRLNNEVLADAVRVLSYLGGSLGTNQIDFLADKGFFDVAQMALEGRSYQKELPRFITIAQAKAYAKQIMRKIECYANGHRLYVWPGGRTEAVYPRKKKDGK